MLSKTEADVLFAPGQSTETGLIVKPGDLIRYTRVSVPFKVVNAAKNGFHLVEQDGAYVANDKDQVVIHGDKKEGSVRVKVIPMG